ncbi:MAG: ATP-grasp domain-containing protein, partial [Planctomycetota bacterium]
CRQMSIPVPFSFTAEEAVDWFQRGGGRLVIKPRVDLGAARGLGFAQSEKELEIALEQCRHSCPDVTIQEYIPGGSESYCSLTVLFDQQSRLIAASTYRKLLTWPLSGGLSAIGLSSYQPELLELMLPLFRHWRWVGAAEVEFRVDERDGRPKVFEINPRVPGYVLFQVYSGIDYPKLALTAAWDHEQLPEIEQLSSYRVGVKNINPGRAIAAARSLTASQGLVRGLSQFGRLARGGLPFVAHQAHYPDDIWLRHLNRE